MIDDTDLAYVSLHSNKEIWLNPSAKNIGIVKSCLNRLLEMGNGEALLLIGKIPNNDIALDDDEILRLYKTLEMMHEQTSIEFTIVQEVKCDQNTHAVRVLFRTSLDNRDDFLEVRVAVIGNVDSGKSTMLGVLTHDMLDDGRGSARVKLFRHKHEVQTGRTSSVGMEILGFSSQGGVVKGSHNRTGNLGWSTICQNSSKIINFIDLAGHEKYLKTTVYGLTGYAPDYCMLMIGANMGIVGMTREHLGLALALQVPLFVVVTKVDISPENVLDRTLQHLHKLLKFKQCRKMPMSVNNMDDVIVCAANFLNDRLCPIFQISNVTGYNIDLLRMFLNLLPVRNFGNVEDDCEFQIDDIYNVMGIGTVVSGIMWNGVLKAGETAFLGPDRSGEYLTIQIRSIHRKRMPVECIYAGQTASLAIKKTKTFVPRKGMIIVTNREIAVSYRFFEADVEILHHPTTIKVKYQAMVHVGAIRQSAQIIGMSLPILRTRDRALVTFVFLRNGEYLKVGQKLVFREGRTKAIGTLTKLFITAKDCVGVAAGIGDEKITLDHCKQLTTASAEISNKPLAKSHKSGRNRRAGRFSKMNKTQQIRTASDEHL